MIFYNGFNLLVDVILVTLAWVLAHHIGFHKGKEINKPPF